MRNFLSLLMLAATVTSQAPQLVVNLQPISQGTLTTQSIYDTCKKIVAISDHIFHVSNQSVYQTWQINDLSRSMNIQTTSNNPQETVKDFEVNSPGTRVVFSVNPTQSILELFILNADHSYNTYKRTSTYVASSPEFVFIRDAYIYTFYPEGPVSGLSTIEVIDEVSGALVNTINLDRQYYRMSISPDFSQAVCWTNQTRLLFVGLPGLDIRGSFASQSTPPVGWTSKISFSGDSSLVVVETDQVNPFLVLSMSNYSIVYSVQISSTIVEASFLNSSNDYVVIISPTSNIILDLRSGQLYQATTELATAYFVKENNIFQCKNNTISQTYVGLQNYANITTIQSQNSSNSTAPNSSNSTAPNSSNSSNSASPSNFSSDSQFYYQLSLSQGQFKVIQYLNTSLAVTTEITGAVATFVDSMPITIYFLSFHNYFALSSLYILLDFPIPEHIYKYLALLYDNINSNFLDLLGFQIPVHPLSVQKVNRHRPLFFKISSDVCSTNAIAFLILAMNIVLISITRWVSSNFPKGNAFRTFMSREYKLIVCGQITNVLVQLTLPWTFLLLNNGGHSYSTKINYAAYLILLFIAVFFPIYFFFQLIHQEKRKLTKKTVLPSKQKLNKLSKPRLNKKQRQKAIKPQKQVRFQDKVKKELKHRQNDVKVGNLRQKSIVKKNQETKRVGKSQSSLRDLLRPQILEQWYLCEVNFLLPVLVLLTSPVPFLVVVLFILTFGLVIAFKRKTQRANYFILSLYQVGFHICFLCFYWCQSPTVLSMVELICLILYLLGSMHYSVTLVYEVSRFLYKLGKEYCKSNKVSPLSSSPIVTGKSRQKDALYRQTGEKVIIEGELIKNIEQSSSKGKKKKVKKTRQLVPSTRIQWIKSNKKQDKTYK